MIAILLIWILVSFSALSLSVTAIWQSRSYWQNVGIRFIFAAMLGAIINHSIAIALCTAAMTTIDPDVRPSVTVIALTVGHVAQALPMTAFSFYMIGLFRSNNGGKKV